MPEAFYKSTFTTADGCPQRSPDDEEDLVMAFDHKMQDTLAQKSRNRDEDEDEDEDRDSD